MALNFEKIEAEIDKALFWETKESLLAWLDEKRNRIVGPQQQVSVEPVVKLKLAEYVQMNFDKYWDEMGETGAENYFETATQKELIAYGQFRAFESVQNFLEGNSKFSV